MALAAPARSPVQIDALLDGEEELDRMAADVRAALAAPGLRELKPKYLYDARGSELFERITRLSEYYPTRCERSILNRHAPEMAAATDAEELVELGSGSASKTRALLFAMAGAGTLRRYVPLDVSEPALRASAEELVGVYPGLEVHGVVGDFERHLEAIPAGERRLVAFLGGTIGNLHPPERVELLGRIRSVMGEEDRLLLGTDLVKDPAALHAAYNDSEGVTAEFNRNMISALNGALDGDLDPGAFEHVAFFDEGHRRVEMRLRALRPVRGRLERAGVDVQFAEGEEVRTEISTKFTPEQVAAELEQAGLRAERAFYDPAGWFAVTLAAPR